MSLISDLSWCLALRCLRWHSFYCMRVWRKNTQFARGEGTESDVQLHRRSGRLFALHQPRMLWISGRFAAEQAPQRITASPRQPRQGPSREDGTQDCQVQGAVSGPSPSPRILAGHRQHFRADSLRAAAPVVSTRAPGDDRFLTFWTTQHAQPVTHTSRFTYRRAAVFNTLKSKTVTW